MLNVIHIFTLPVYIATTSDSIYVRMLLPNSLTYTSRTTLTRQISTIVWSKICTAECSLKYIRNYCKCCFCDIQKLMCMLVLVLMWFYNVFVYLLIYKTQFTYRYCPGGPDSDFEYSTQSYTGYEPTSMRAIRARYNPYLQAKHRIDQVCIL